MYVGKTKLGWTSIISTDDEVKFVNVESPSVKTNKQKPKQTQQKKPRL